MASRRLSLLVAALLVAAVVVTFAYQLGLFAYLTGTEDRATVTITGEDGGTLATVEAEVADTPHERYTGLSDHESLGEHEGMLFVFDEESTQSFVMRDMAFPIDMIFVGEDGRITTIHEASLEDDESSYRGEAKWVLEVNYGYAAEHGINEGDRVEVEYR